MTLDERIEQLNYQHGENIETLTKWTKMNTDFGRLMKAILESEVNPYIYLPHTLAGLLHGSEGWIRFGREINHAMFIESISFLTVNDVPRIVLRNHNEEHFMEAVLTKREKHERDANGVKYEIIVLEGVDDFIKSHDRYHEERIHMLENIHQYYEGFSR